MDNFGSKNTILLVDDEQVVLDVATLMMNKIGYKVIQAANGTEATKIFEENVDDICLAVLDMQLPDENGSTTCKRLKGIKPDVKILHTSGLGRTADGTGFTCGCNGFLPKPFRLEELSNKLKELLEYLSE